MNVPLRANETVLLLVLRLHNRPRIGRIVVAYGRDATDCAITTSFGQAPLVYFSVHTHEVFDVA